MLSISLERHLYRVERCEEVILGEYQDNESCSGYFTTFQIRRIRPFDAFVTIHYAECVNVDQFVDGGKRFTDSDVAKKIPWRKTLMVFSG